MKRKQLADEAPLIKTRGSRAMKRRNQFADEAPPSLGSRAMYEALQTSLKILPTI